MDPVVFAVVLNHNGASWLPRCLETLLACGCPNLRVILVDNASTDGSLALARAAFPDVEVIQNRANLGFCAANNLAIDRALNHGADYVALVNNDTWSEPGWITRILEVAESHPSIGILGPVQLAYDSDDFNTWTLTALPQLLDALRRDSAPGLWYPVEWVEGSCLVARRELFARIGRLDPIFFDFFEEIDLCRRARAAGFHVAVVPSSRIHHYGGGAFNRHARRRRYRILRSSMIYNSTDPALPWSRNLLELARNNAVHLKESIRRPAELSLWFRATLSVLLLLPALRRKWRSDRARAQPCAVPTPLSSFQSRAS